MGIIMENQNELYELSGQVESIVYRNEENGSTVIELAGETEMITAVGTMPLISVGEQVKLYGTFKKHPSYGQQFSATACERSMPENLDGILKYLSSGAIKGVGPATASRLVKEFGADTPDRQRERLMLAYKMIAVCRLVLKNVNIAAATALSALDPERGRVDGLNSGANVIMPNAGNKSCRKDYYLYQNKPDTGEELPVISAGIAEAGCTVELFTQGNPPR